MIHLPKILQPSQPNQILSQLDQLPIRRGSVRPRSFESFDLESFAGVEGKVSGEVVDVDGVGCVELREFVPEELEAGLGEGGEKGREKRERRCGVGGEREGRAGEVSSRGVGEGRERKR